MVTPTAPYIYYRCLLTTEKLVKKKKKNGILICSFHFTVLNQKLLL